LQHIRLSEWPPEGALPFAAVCIDNDGTLVESEQLLVEACVEMCAARGADFRTFDYARIIGKPDLECCRIVVEHFGFEGDVKDWHARYFAIVDRLIDEKLRLRPGAAEFLRALERLRVPTALVTSGSSHHAGRIIDKFGFRPYFRTMVTSDDLHGRRGKPEPLPYLMAAERLAVAPDRCVAFEDSPAGVTSAKAAGMFTVAIPHAYSPERNLVSAGADLVIASLADFHPAMAEHH
jgi:HAD superfamily hydrolase (TIGR01509 family)